MCPKTICSEKYITMKNSFKEFIFHNKTSNKKRQNENVTFESILLLFMFSSEEVINC